MSQFRNLLGISTDYKLKPVEFEGRKENVIRQILKSIIFNPLRSIANRRIIVLYVYYILNSEVLKFEPNFIENCPKSHTDILCIHMVTSDEIIVMNINYN